MPERSSGSGENLNTAIMDTAPPFVPLNPTLLYFPLKNGKRRLEGRREEGGRRRRMAVFKIVKMAK